MTSAFSEIEPIFHCLCQCTKYAPNDANFLWDVMRAAEILLTHPNLANGLIELINGHLAIIDHVPECGPEIGQKSQEYLMAVTLRLIRECNQLGSEVTDLSLMLKDERQAAHLQE